MENVTGLLFEGTALWQGQEPSATRAIRDYPMEAIDRFLQHGSECTERDWPIVTTKYYTRINSWLKVMVMVASCIWDDPRAVFVMGNGSQRDISVRA